MADATSLAVQVMMYRFLELVSRCSTEIHATV